MNRAAAIVVAAALVVSACSAADPVKDTSTSTQAPASSVAAGDTTETTTETTSGTTEPTVEPDGRRIVVVVDEIRAVALAETAAQFTADMGVEVVFDIRPLSEIRARAGDPDVDIFMGPHTWQTELDSKAATRPIEGVDDIWSNQALDAFRLSAGVMAAVPFSAESLVMFRNTDLLAAAPLDLSDGCGDIPQSCVVMPGLGAGGGYHMTPFLMGGAVNDLDSAFETPDPGALEALGDLIDAGTLELMSITAARQAFIAGSAAMFIGGPWDLGPIEDAGIGFAVDPLPSAAGFNLRAPTSVLGFYLASASPQSDAATTFLVDYLADASAQRALYLRDRRAPVHSALDDLGDTARALAAGVNDGFLLPQGDLAVYWKELGLALEEIVGGVDPATAVISAGQRIAERLGG